MSALPAELPARGVSARRVAETLRLRYRTHVYRHERFLVLRLEQLTAQREPDDGLLAFHGVNEPAAGDPPRPLLEMLYEDFARAGDRGLVATLGGAVAGWVWARRGPYLEPLGCGEVRVGDFEVIRYLEVTPPFRGRGLGTRLLREFTRRLWASGSRRLIAFVGETNTRSRRVFERNGFTGAGVLDVQRVLGRPLRKTLDDLR